MDLVKIASWHRRCTLLALVMFGFFVGMIILAVQLPGFSPYINLMYWLIAGILVLLSIIFVVCMNQVCGGSVLESILHGVFAFMFSWFMVISAASNAGTILRLAGAKAGFLGVGGDELNKLRPGHCRGCGYSREGLELLQECPECTRVPQVI